MERAHWMCLDPAGAFQTPLGEFAKGVRLVGWDEDERLV